MTFLKVVLLLTLYSIGVKAQDQSEIETAKSLVNSLEHTSNDSIKLELLLKLADLTSTFDKEKTIYYYQQALRYNITNQRKALVLNTIGFDYWSLGDFNTALDYYHQSLTLYKELQDSTRLGVIFNNIASANWSLGKWNMALTYYQKALKFRRAANELRGVSNTLNNIGLIYQDFGLYDEALDYHNEALEIATDINNTAAISYSYSNIGLCYRLKKELKLAMKFHKLGYKTYSENKNNGRNNSYYLANIGEIFRQLGRLDSAIYYANQSLEQANLINNAYRIAVAENNLGKSYLLLENFKVADTYLNKSYSSALKNNYKDLLRDNQFALAKIEEAKGNTKKALYYYKNATAIEDILFNKEEISKFSQIIIEEIKEKERREKALLKENIDIQQTKISEEKTIRWTILSATILLLAALAFISRSRISIKKLNTQLLQSEKELKKANADKLKFFSIISHDLKSPFNSIIGLSNLLTLEIKAKNSNSIGVYASKIHSASQKAMDLLSNLTEWALSQTGKMGFTLEKFDISEIINENTLLFSNIAEQKSIILTSTTKGTLLVNADKSMINTVFRNLISNANKFTNSKGNVNISSSIKNNQVEIAVKDSGVGLSKSSKNKLFRIDVQFSTSGTQNEEGTGLGLMLCKEFIEKHQGNIWVESQLDKGSTFYFTLPVP